MNAPESVITCNSHKSGPLPSYSDTFWYKHGFNECIPMRNGIALATTMFTIGGLLSSLAIGSNKISTTYGRKMICFINALFFFFGSLIMTLSNTEWQMNLGRFLNGIGSGLSLVISPILINELTPVNHRGLLGSSLQLAVVTGILLAQVISFNWSNVQQWRRIFVFATGLALWQFLMLFTTVESPKWLVIHQGDVHNATSILKDLRSNKSKVNQEINHWRRLSTNSKSDTEELMSTPLLGPNTIPQYTENPAMGSMDLGHVSTGEFITTKKYRREFVAVTIIMTAQQLCGMNALTFYGVSILSSVVPEGTNVLILTCSLSFCNVVAALIGAPFVDKFPRKTLLLTSITAMGISSLLVAFGLLHQLNYIATVACFFFIIAFSIGLGPIPFIITPELTNHASVGPAQSVGSAMNWTTNILLAYLFPLGQSLIGGYVFYIFFAISMFYIVCVTKLVPETLERDTYDIVWNNPI